MKRIAIITLALLVVAIGGISVWRLTGPHGVSEVYSRYADIDGVRVGFIKDYPFDDSTAVDVTTIEALDPEGWTWMQDEFDLPDPDPRRAAILANGGDALLTMQRPSDRSFLFLSYRERKLCLVDIDNDNEFQSILRYHLEQLKR